jgi:hypothetical protein
LVEAARPAVRNRRITNWQRGEFQLVYGILVGLAAGALGAVAVALAFSPLPSRSCRQLQLA